MYNRTYANFKKATMRRAILMIVGICFVMSLQAGTLIIASITAGSLSSAPDTIITKAPYFETMGGTNAPVPMHMNNQGMDGNKNIPPNLNRHGMDQFKPERNFEFERIESEKQTVAEMENYRSEILVRLINEEYYRLINNKTLDLTDNNRDRISRLAKYRTLRDLLYEQISKRNKPALPGTVSNNLHLNNPMELNNMVQQLDVKIREEEQRLEMLTRHRMEMERRIEQENQNQKK